MIAEAVLGERRNVAIVVAGLLLAGALLSFFALRTLARIDRCLDHGGRWTADGICRPRHLCGNRGRLAFPPHHHAP